MKKKILSFLLALVVVTGVSILPSSAADQTDAVFFMKAASKAAGPVETGDRFTVEVYGGLQDGADKEHKMSSFQFTLDYPKGHVKLVSLAPAGIYEKLGTYEVNEETGSLSYNAMAPGGMNLNPGKGSKLATAEFEVLPSASTGDITIGLTNAEIVHIKDKDSSCQVREGATVHLVNVPMVGLPAEGSVESETLDVQLHNNPAGTLVAAVYNADGRMLRCAAEKVSANTGYGSHQLKLMMKWGSYVKLFLLDSSGCAPVCYEARMELK